jgi:hypothetical protein
MIRGCGICHRLATDDLPGNKQVFFVAQGSSPGPGGIFDAVVMRPRQWHRVNGLVTLIYDVENVILTGKIIKRQRDRVSNEWKYLVGGRSLAGDSVIVVVKFSPTGKLILITVFRE